MAGSISTFCILDYILTRPLLWNNWPKTSRVLNIIQIYMLATHSGICRKQRSSAGPHYSKHKQSLKAAFCLWMFLDPGGARNCCAIDAAFQYRCHTMICAAHAMILKKQKKCHSLKLPSDKFSRFSLDSKYLVGCIIHYYAVGWRIYYFQSTTIDISNEFMIYWVRICRIITPAIWQDLACILLYQIYRCILLTYNNQLNGFISRANKSFALHLVLRLQPPTERWL